MLPPVDNQVLGQNPAFASIYSTLTNAILNPDGSTRHGAGAENRAVIKKELVRRRLSTAKNQLVERALTTAASDSRQQPTPSEPLLQLLQLLPSIFDGDKSLSPEAEALLIANPPFSNLETLLPELAALTSSSLHSSALGLARVFNPTTDSSVLHRRIPSLPDTYASIHADVAVAQRALGTCRMRILASLSRLSTCYAQSVVYLVRSLEAKHGVVARSLELRASDVCLRAQRTDVEASAALNDLTKELYPPQAVYALQNYVRSLKHAKLRMTDSVRALGAELDEYGVDVAGSEEKENTATN
ncbi:hypothetical protein GQ602_001830 [Ophiocordyceps camponoti-floridani]|uniref:Uncharacterized protein n=1 Tax=Ophiocordyceps camponoti-floridani TaxID=2030778 RepID=A0A8H4Q9L1_9HYPO|nr:hypothetical protein GQ602_001830 [Ophiocordyceps camponoti-floridani]